MSPSARGAAAAAADWPTYNGPLSGDRYSPLSQITPASVSQLREKCAFTMPDSAHVLALDARAGKELWRSATGKAIGGGVISYDAGGKPYVAAATGLNSPIWSVHGGTARVVIYGVQ